MKFEELTKRVVEEELDQYCILKIGTLYGPECSICIRKNNDGTFSVRYYGEREKIRKEFLNISEEEACQMVYNTAAHEKRAELAYREREKKTTEPEMKM